jgi:hypothetical protein
MEAFGEQQIFPCFFSHIMKYSQGNRFYFTVHLGFSLSHNFNVELYAWPKKLYKSIGRPVSQVLLVRMYAANHN